MFPNLRKCTMAIRTWFVWVRSFPGIIIFFIKKNSSNSQNFIIFNEIIFIKNTYTENYPDCEI